MNFFKSIVVIIVSTVSSSANAMIIECCARNADACPSTVSFAVEPSKLRAVPSVCCVDEGIAAQYDLSGGLPPCPIESTDGGPSITVMSMPEPGEETNEEDVVADDCCTLTPPMTSECPGGYTKMDETTALPKPGDFLCCSAPDDEVKMQVWTPCFMEDNGDDGDVHVTSHTDTNTTEEKEVKDGDSGAEIATDSSAASTYHLAIAVSMILVGAALQ